MTPTYDGAVQTLDDFHEAVYRYGSDTSPAPGWYVRHHWRDKPREIVAGPFETAVVCGIWLAEHLAEHEPTIYGPTLILAREHLTTGRRVRIDAFVKLECAGGVELGDDVHLASFVHFIGGGPIRLGNGASCGSGAKIVSGSAEPNPRGCSAQIPDLPTTRRAVVLEDRATLYAGAIVLPGCTIGEGAVVAAGSVVLSGTWIPPYELWAGQPARYKKRLPAPPSDYTHLEFPHVP